TQPKAYPLAAWIPILVTTAEPQKQPNQRKNVNQRNVNQRRSPDDAERETREMVLSQILFSHSLERKCLEDVILRAAQMEQIVEKVCEEQLNTGAVAVIAQAVEHEDNHGIEDERKVFKNTTEEKSQDSNTTEEVSDKT
ncbi:hypothetical protein HID58_045823, partial [Brassica napus]